MVFEPINPEQILHFLRLQDARRIGNENGPLFVELNYLYRRCKYVNGVGYCVRVVLWHLPHAHSFSGRRYSRLSPWGTYPSEDPDLLLCMQNEVFKRIPRTFLTRSAFAASKLVKTVARTPPALAQWVHVDVDMCFSYIQLRANRIKNEGNFPDGFTLHLELGNVETCDQARGVRPAGDELQEAGEATPAGHVQRFRCGELAPERWHPRLQRGGR